MRLAKRKMEKGKYTEAQKIYESILQKFPKNKRAKEALASLGKKREIVDSRPSQQDLQILIDKYNRGRIEEARQDTQHLLQNYPTHAPLHNILGAIFRKLERHSESVSAFKTAVHIEPNFVEAINNLGVALRDNGKIAEAISAYERVIELRPDYAEAHNNLGNALKDTGDYAQSLCAFRQALKIRSDYAEAYDNMGNVLQLIGQHQDAVILHKKAIDLNPNLTDAIHNLGNALKWARFQQPFPSLEDAILLMLKKRTVVRPVEVIQAALSLLKQKPNINKYLRLDSKDLSSRSYSELVSDLSSLPLLIELMHVCPITDATLESLFINLRAKMLFNVEEVPFMEKELTLASALANQCYTNEYVYTQTKLETQCFLSLSEKISELLSKNLQPRSIDLLRFATYAPLNELQYVENLLATNVIKDVYNRQISEPKLERKIQSNMPSLAQITDGVSSKVKMQYEENPYPRWVQLGLSARPKTITEYTKLQKINADIELFGQPKNPKVLIAGCGTGQNSIGTASLYSGAEVLAIDLSFSSLAYAKRKTDELGLKNIEYLQADILDLDKLKLKFDLIECAGVLHHMDDPKKGWNSLVNCLKVGGLMKIGLYSALARQHITKIRREIIADNIGSSNEAMKNYRDLLKKSKMDHHKFIVRSPDFFSLSNFRDLLFHVQEHQFTIPKIKNYLSELDLIFCGFETDLVWHFKKIHEKKDDLYDLEKWNEFEKKNPKFFGAMYQFWCQKI